MSSPMMPPECQPDATVTLRNGKEVPKGVVVPAMLSLEFLAAGNPIALYELVTLARDPSHRMFASTAAALVELGLLERNGRLHDATRDVILAAAEGEGLEMVLQSPYAEGARP